MAISTGWIDYDEGAAPATPAAGDVRIYAKTDGLLYSKDDAGTETLVSGGTAAGGAVATDAIWTTSGKVAVATGTATATEQWPPGHEFDYAESTSSVNPTATTAATADLIITGNSVTFDGAPVWVEFFSPSTRPDSTAAARSLTILLLEDGSRLGYLCVIFTPAAQADKKPTIGRRRLTPSAGAHTYSVRAFVNAGTGAVEAQSGIDGAYMPMYLRITKA